MKLSILDQVPLFQGADAKEAMEASIDLAVAADKLGYERYWIAEHHDMDALASPAPDILLGIIGSRTSKIRIGSGAVLLPNYQPYAVAERYRMLAALYPHRVDIGLGRAPGGSAEASVALAENFLERVQKMPEYIDELLHFFQDDFPEEHLYSKVTATPVPKVQPKAWLLGTSQKSAELAISKKLPYVFGHFMGADEGPEIVSRYRKMIGVNHPVIVAVSILCARTDKEALELTEEVARKEKERNGNKYKIKGEKEQARKQISGSPDTVRKKLDELQQLYQCDEIMVLTMAPTYQLRKDSYEMLAKIM